MVPLDGSALSERALGWGVVLARRRHSPLLLVRVVEPWSASPAGMPMYGSTMETSAFLPELDRIPSENYLAEHAASLRAQYPTLWVQTDVRIGQAAAQLLDSEAEHHAQLVVMSTHSHSGAERWVRGSVAEKMLHHGAAPILLVRPSDELPIMEGVPGNGITVLVPLDRSELAVGAVSEALRLVRTFEGTDPTIVLFMALDERTMPLVGRAWSVDDQDRSRTTAKRQAEVYLREVGGLLRAHGVRVDQSVVFAEDVSQAVVDAAVRAKANVIVMCTHGRGAFGRWLHGSVADRVAHAAPMPVMLYRPPVPVQPTDVAQTAIPVTLVPAATVLTP